GGGPGVNATGPEEKALLVVAYLLDDVGWKGQTHKANGFLADRGSRAQQGGRSVFYDVSLARIRITPALWANAVDDRQYLFSFGDGRSLFFEGNRDLLVRRAKSSVSVLNSPVGEFAVDLLQLAGCRPRDQGQVF